MKRADKPLVENDFYVKILFDPNAIVLKDSSNKSNKTYPIYISHYTVRNDMFWRVRFLHIRINGLASRQHAIEGGKSLVQAYLQGKL